MFSGFLLAILTVSTHGLTCPSGYQDKTTGEAYNWECGCSCPGGCWTDGHCACACINTLCDDSCAYSRDGECDDGGPGAEYSLCTAGSEQTDCGCEISVISPPPPFPPAVLGFDSPLDTIPVLNQKQCGSCYVFAATQVFRMRMGASSLLGSNVEISPEDVISCNIAGNGCSGGLPAQVFNFMEKSGAATCSSSCTAGCAPYEGEKESCPSSCSDGSSLTRFYPTSSSSLLGGGWETNNPATESSIMDEIRNNGPVAVAINVPSNFDSYWSSNPKAVMMEDSGDYQGGHAIVMTGWGTALDGSPYWKLKNSWGPGWGDHGYFYLKRGVNFLGVESYVTFNSGGVSTSPTRRALSGTDDTMAVHRAKPGGPVGLPGGWTSVRIRPSHETLRVLFAQSDHDGRTLHSIDEALSQVVGGFQFQLNWTSTHPIKGVATHFSQLYKPHGNGTMIIIYDNYANINWPPWAIALFWATSGALISSLTMYMALYLRGRRARPPLLSLKDLEASSVRALDRPL